MLKQLILENWKSFRYAELPLDPLTVLIGTNASGKSNVVEALEFLQRIAQGENIEAALAGDKTLASIRGGVDWAARKPESQFTLKVLIQGEDETTDYLYVITIKTQPEVRVIKEYIEFKFGDKNKVLTLKNSNFTSKSGLKSFQSSVEVYELMEFTPVKGKKLWQDEDFLEVFNNHYLPLKNKITLFVVSILEKTFILNPIPSKMRDYSRLSDTLESDAANIAGVLAALSDNQKEEVESALSNYIKDLPEGDIKKVWAEKVGRFGTDAMLYCQEEWQPGEITEMSN
jgi:hypothetical protein